MSLGEKASSRVADESLLRSLLRETKQKEKINFFDMRTQDCLDTVTYDSQFKALANILFVGVQTKNNKLATCAQSTLRSRL
jgi:hypothetical protein